MVEYKSISSLLSQQFEMYLKDQSKLGFANCNIYQQIIDVVDKILISSTLKHVNWSKVKAAKILGISRTTLSKKICVLNISNE